MNKVVVIVLTLFSAAVLGQQQEQEALNQARAKWEGVLAGLKGDVDYNYAYLGEGDMFPQYQVLVRNRTEVSYYTIYDPVPDTTTLYSVDGLLDEIQKGIDDFTDVKVNATYNQDFGYPMEWTIESATNKFSGQMEQFSFFTLLEKEWNQNLFAWDNLLKDDYNYTVRVIGFLPEEYTSPKRIQVRNGVIQTIVDIGTGSDVDLNVFPYPTVLDAFDQIGTALNVYYGAMRAEYDDTLFYPTDYLLEPDIFVADGANSVSITDLVFANGIPANAQAELDSHKAMWESHSLQDYHFGILRTCYCVFNDPISIQVSNQQVTQMTTRFGTIVTEADTFYSYTMEEIFEVIQTAIVEGYDGLDVTYDDFYGYPTMVMVDDSKMIADDEFTLTIDYLAPISDWQSDLNAAKSTWNTYKSTIDNTYNYTYQRACECPDDATLPKFVQIVEGLIVAVNGSPIVAIERTNAAADTPPTFDGLMDAVQNGINQNAFFVNVQYDPNYGYPTSIYIDYDEKIADEELIVSAKLAVVGDADKGPGEAPTGAPVEPDESTASTMMIQWLFAMIPLVWIL